MGSMSLAEMWGTMGPTAKAVVFILAFMSIYSIGVMFERFMTFRQARKQSREFVNPFAECLKNNRLDDALAISEKNNKIHLAKVLFTGLSEFQAHQKSAEIPGDVIDASRRAL